MRHAFLAAFCHAVLTVAGAGALQAECAGMNLLDVMPPDRRLAVEQMADAQPFPEGNFWTATRDGQSLTILGTYHLDDPRHAPVAEAAAGRIADARLLLVEAGPDEEKDLLAHMARDPSAMFITQGPTLYQILPEDTWNQLADAMSDRGIPGIMAAKFQPWYATVMLAIPPCAMAEMTDPKGLDGLLIDAALAADVPVRALEPYDTVLTLFGGMTEAQQVDMIESSLAMEPQAVDFSITLADAYFDGESRLMWELMRVVSYDQPGVTRAEVDAELALMEEILVARRNRAWIPVIEAAAAQAEGPVVVAFGALHLPGQDGVLNLLTAAGWAVSPLALP